MTAIAQRLGCSRSTVWTLLRGRPPRRGHAPLDPAQVQRYRDGEDGIRDIAAAVGCSLRQARGLLTDAGVDVWADDERLLREIVIRYTKQMQSIRAIAAEIDRSYGYVHRCLTDAEVTMRTRGARPPRRAASAAPQPDADPTPPTPQGGTPDDTP